MAAGAAGPSSLISLLLVALAGAGCADPHPLADAFADANARIVGSEDARWERDRAHHVLRLPSPAADLRVGLAWVADANFTLALTNPDGDVVKALRSNDAGRSTHARWYVEPFPEFGPWRVDLDARDGRVFYVLGLYWNSTRPA